MDQLSNAKKKNYPFLQILGVSGVNGCGANRGGEVVGVVVVVVVVVLVGYWWWRICGGSGVDSLCNGCSLNICRISELKVVVVVVVVLVVEVVIEYWWWWWLWWL